MLVGYGKKIRDMVNATQKNAKKRYKCPSCSRVTVRHTSLGVWQCTKCNTKFASGAYQFRQ